MFELRVYQGQDAVTHKHVYRTATVRGSRREADSVLARMVAAAEDARVVGSTAPPRTVTLNQLITAYLAGFQGSPTSLRSYQGMHARYIEATIGRYPLDRLDTRIISQFYAYLGKEHGLAPASVRRYHALIRGAFKQAMQWGWLARNPAVEAALPKAEKPESITPTSAQVRAAVVEAYRLDAHLGVFVLLAAATGARRGELCGLRWQSVDLAQGVVRIEVNLVNVEGGTLLKDTKNHSKRNVTLDPATTEALRVHHGGLVERAAACATVLSGESYVFSHAADGLEPWHPDTASARWATVRERVGLDGVRLHDLRHYQATTLLAAGVPVNNVSKRIGHRDAAVTLNVYGGALAELDHLAASVIGDALAPPPLPGRRGN